VGINSRIKKKRFFNREKLEIQDTVFYIKKNYNTTQALGIIEAEMEAT
jgi:UDP-N-acetylglucosamine acyltransferase